MTHRQYIIAALGILLAIGAVGVPAAGASNVHAVDTDHSLVSDSSMATFDAEEVVSGNVDGLDMTITVADKVSQLNKSEWAHASSARTFLRVEYDEEIDRTVRVYIPTEYFRPRVKSGLAPLESGPAAQLQPVKDRQYTAVTITFEEETTAIYPISAPRGAISSGRSGVSDLVENSTGFSLPKMTSGGAEWQPVPGEAMTDTEATYRIPSNETDITVQYDAEESAEEERWLTVQSCDRSDQPVCTFDRDGSNATYLLSTTEDVPPVRWKAETTATDTFWSTWNDVEDAGSGLKEAVGGLFGSE